MTSQKDEMRWQ